MAPPSGSSSKSWFDLLIDALAVLAAALIVLLTVLIVVDVALRAPRLFTIPWSLEAAEYMLYAITFLGAPWVLREEGHIAIELVVELLPPGLQRGVQRLADLIGAVVCGVLFVYACRVMWRSWQGGVMVRKSFSFPEWVVFAGVPLVMLILLGIYLRWIVRPHAGPGRQLRRGL